MNENDQSQSIVQENYMETSFTNFDDGQDFTSSQFQLMGQGVHSRSNVISPLKQNLFDKNTMGFVQDTDITPREPHKTWAQPGYTQERAKNSRNHGYETYEMIENKRIMQLQER